MDVNTNLKGGAKIETAVICKNCHELQSIECEGKNDLVHGTSHFWSTSTATCASEDNSTREGNLTQDNDCEKEEVLSTLDCLQLPGIGDHNTNIFENVAVNNSTNPSVRNIIQFHGPVHITQSRSVANQQFVTNQVFLEPSIAIVDRRSWLAQPPLAEKEYLDKPAKYVIICHSATEEGLTRPENIYLVRTIQMYHIESKRLNDIGYNFLIGSDGNVYEGSGWGVIGAHTFGYDDISIGLAFVGCFVNKLPPREALTQAKALINHGVEIGYIDKEYRLVTRSQCLPFETSTKLLDEEIETWNNWYNMKVLDN